jgi:hypothetical protein
MASVRLAETQDSTSENATTASSSSFQFRQTRLPLYITRRHNPAVVDPMMSNNLCDGKVIGLNAYRGEEAFKCNTDIVLQGL